ncbi:MAG: phytanoyl-CoA dioxygenase family protein, partial [Opitutaceae bacterium]|nr:phytanoyl-CoA dioxygenase family protein [Opitutaceae bacterium]MBP9914117.1 phytanoyl-CoA dioxygenase family protein [Opitutaceae bacterium]
MSTATPAQPDVQFDPGSEMHAPELYQPVATGFGVDHFEDIGPREIEFYRENGYLLVRQAFTAKETADALQGLLDLIAGKRPDFTGLLFEAKAKELIPTLSPEQRQDYIRKLWYFVEFDARLKALSHHPKLLGIVQTLIGDKAPHMFQDMALIKPPRLGREKPWHQDKAYFDFPLATPVVGVWIALDEATVENGCMQILPGRHKDGPKIHFQRRDWQICDNQMLGTQSAAAPLKPGGLLLFDGLMPHGTPHNSSPNRRRALQYHYAPADVVKST